MDMVLSLLVDALRKYPAAGHRLLNTIVKLFSSLAAGS